LKESGVLSMVNFNLRVASLVFRWNTEYIVFSLLSFRRLRWQ